MSSRLGWFRSSRRGAYVAARGRVRHTRVNFLVPEEVATCHVISSVLPVAHWLAQVEHVTVGGVRQPGLTVGEVTTAAVVCTRQQAQLVCAMWYLSEDKSYLTRIYRVSNCDQDSIV